MIANECRYIKILILQSDYIINYFPALIPPVNIISQENKLVAFSDLDFMFNQFPERVKTTMYISYSEQSFFHPSDQADHFTMTGLLTVSFPEFTGLLRLVRKLSVKTVLFSFLIRVRPDFEQPEQQSSNPAINKNNKQVKKIPFFLIFNIILKLLE